MALSGLHVECGYAGGPGLQQALIPTNGKLLWSQTLVSGQQTTTPVPGPDQKLGAPILSCRASADMFFAIGRNPDPINGPCRLVRAGTGFEVFPKPGEYLACLTASLASGVFITCGYGAGQGFDGELLPLLGDAVWSQQMAVGGTATLPTPSKSHSRGNPIISISTARGTEIYFAIDLPEKVDVSVNPRRYLGFGEDADFFAEPGQKIAWTLA